MPLAGFFIEGFSLGGLTMTQLQNAQNIAAFAALLDDPMARRIAQIAAATQLIDDPAAKRSSEQALGLALAGAAADAVSKGMSNSQAGEYRDVAVERDGSIVARFMGGNTDTVHRFGDRFIHQTADMPALPAPANVESTAEKLAAE